MIRVPIKGSLSLNKMQFSKQIVWIYWNASTKRVLLVYLDPPIYAPAGNSTKMDFEVDNEGYRRHFTFLAQVIQR